MSSKVKPVPEGYHTITPYLSIDGAAAALAFYKKAFGAVEVLRMDMPGGKIGHAEIDIEGSRIMLADYFPDMPDSVAIAPRSLKGTSVGFNVYLPDVDARFARAIEAGATIRRPVTTQFYGDWSGTLEDPFGHVWTLSTHVEDVSPDEMAKRAAAAHGG